jgi:protein phosphatase
MPERVIVELAGRSDVGLLRENNEDHLLIGDLDRGELAAGEAVIRHADGARGPLLVVCDGMGGVAGGEVASRLAAQVLWEEMRDAPATAERAVFARHLRRAIRAANRRLREEGERDPALRGMGTTVSAAGLCGEVLVVAQVGDSRAYVERRGALTQVTRDQSVVSALVHAGRLSESEARASEQRSLILQALGAAADVDVALSIVELRQGDRLLLCSDGLHGPVADLALAATLSEQPEVEAAAAALIRLAHTAGGPDNTTVVVARFSGEGLRPAGPDDELRFAEFDPMEEGDRALTDTSLVSRRLAAKAGLRRDMPPPAIPATGQHRVVRIEALEPGEDAGGSPLGPAGRRLAAGRRLGPWAWLVAILAIGLAAAMVLARCSRRPRPCAARRGGATCGMCRVRDSCGS